MAHILPGDDHNNNGVANSFAPRPGSNVLVVDLNTVALLTSVNESLDSIPSHTLSHLVMRSNSMINRLEIAESEMLDLLQKLTRYAFQSLEINRINFDIPVHALAALIKKSGPTLKKLRLKKISLSGWKDESSFVALCTAIDAVQQPLESASFSLTVLPSYNGNRHGNRRRLYPNGIRPLIKVLAKNSRSLELDVASLSYVWCGEEPDEKYQREMTLIQALADALGSENTTLTELAISIWDARAVLPLINALRKNQTLKTLTVSSRPGLSVPPNVTRDACEMTKDNFVLQRLDLARPGYYYGAGNNNESPFLECLDMALYLKLNRAGRKFLLQSEASTRQDWVNTIIEHCEDTRMVQYLLSKNPALLCE